MTFFMCEGFTAYGLVPVVSSVASWENASLTLPLEPMLLYLARRSMYGAGGGGGGPYTVLAAWAASTIRPALTRETTSVFCTCSEAVMSAAMPPTAVGELTRARGLLDGGVAGISCVKGCDLGGVPGMTLSTEDPRGLAVSPGGVLGDMVAWCSGPSPNDPRLPMESALSLVESGAT